MKKILFLVIIYFLYGCRDFKKETILIDVSEIRVVDKYAYNRYEVYDKNLSENINIVIKYKLPDSCSSYDNYEFNDEGNGNFLVNVYAIKEKDSIYCSESGESQELYIVEQFSSVGEKTIKFHGLKNETIQVNVN